MSRSAISAVMIVFGAFLLITPSLVLERRCDAPKKIQPLPSDQSPYVLQEEYEVVSFRELPLPKGEKLQRFAITLKSGDGSTQHVVVNVESSLIRSWATETIRSSLSW
ncbi:MAG: hypothetical protein EXS60_02135 [Candidatus Pacebacteria bacterium]|nr:hypothetical protein [Candidatus Paceibacterota bacterium]